MKLMFLGDVMGRSGRSAVAERLPALRRDWGLDFVVVNGENATGGDLGKVQGADDAGVRFAKLQHVLLVESMIAQGDAIGARLKDQPRRAVDMPGHGLLIKRMIAQRDAIRARIEQPLGVFRRQAHARGGVLAIDHDKIEAPVASQPRQPFGHRAAPRAPHHITEKEYPHSVSLRRAIRQEKGHDPTTVFPFGLYVEKYPGG